VKIYPHILKNIIDLPENLRRELDTLGLEVKDETPDYYNIETLANRGDHLSHVGVARDLAARFNRRLNFPSLASELNQNSGELLGTKTVESKAFSILEVLLDEVPYLNQDIRKLVPEKEGRPALVDLLNYVQLELGQPMHAYDASKVKGRISVVLSNTPREIVGLDGKRYIVPADSLLVVDQEKVIAVAGVIGCENTMCEPDTKHVLIEAAHFDPVLVRKTARGMGISTDASYNFERGVDPELFEKALRRVLALLGPHKIGRYQVLSEKPEDRVVSFVPELIRLEMNNPEVQDSRIVQVLESLGFQVEASRVKVPSWRLFDVANREDIVEEVIRIIGLDSVNSILPPLSSEEVKKNNLEILYERLSPALLGAGFTEIVTRSFFSPKHIEVYEKLNPGGKVFRLKNSIEATHGALKPNNIFHLVDVCTDNLRRGVQSVKVFEIGRVFSEPFSSFDYERDILSLAVAGRFHKGEWGKKEDLSTLSRLFKGVLEEIGSSFGRVFEFAPSEHPFFDSAATISVEGRIVGHFGLPRQEILDDVDVLVAEFFVEELIGLYIEPTLNLPSDYPKVKRDITILGSKFAYEMTEVIKSFKSDLIESVEMVNDFTKDGKRKATYRIHFHSRTRTLTNDEVDSEMSKLLDLLNKSGFPLA
jgi:phenylalanyl-tRNA synthetase beta chain